MSSKFIENALYISGGITVTMEYALLSLLIGFIIASVLTALRHEKYGTWIIDLYVSIFRGTPVILQLSFFYFSFSSMINHPLSIFQAGILTLSLNSTAYMIEIFRSGIQSIPVGQFEAAKTLGISKINMWLDIIFPQLLRNCWPSLINEVIVLIKETALISILGELDIMRRSQTIAAESFNYFEPIVIAGFYYYLLVTLMAFIGGYIERKWLYGKNK